MDVSEKLTSVFCIQHAYDIYKMKKRLGYTETQIKQSAVSDVRAAVYEIVSKLASDNVAAVKLAQLVVEARGIEKVEALLVIFAKLRNWLYFAVFYDFAFSSFK